MIRKGAADLLKCVSRRTPLTGFPGAITALPRVYSAPFVPVSHLSTNAYERLKPTNKEERIAIKKTIGLISKEEPSPWKLDVIPGVVRPVTGTNISKKHRKQGYLPSIVHGITKKRLIISVDKGVVSKLVKNKPNFMNSVVELDIKHYPKRVYAIPKLIQRDILTREVIAITFMRYVPGKKYRIPIPIHYHGMEDCPALRSGYFMMQLERTVDCFYEGPPDEIPEDITIDLLQVQKRKVFKIPELPYPPTLTPAPFKHDVISTMIKSKR